MVGNQKVLLIIAYRPQVLRKLVIESTFGLTNIEEATLGLMAPVDQFGGCTSEPLSNMESLSWASDGSERRCVGAVRRWSGGMVKTLQSLGLRPGVELELGVGVETVVSGVGMCMKMAPEAEYELLLLQFAGGVIVTLEEAPDGHVIKGVGGEVKMVSNQTVLLIIVYEAQVFCESITETALGLTDIEQATSGATDTVDQVGGCTDESLSDMESLSGALDE
eukprot:g38161.t1